MDKNNNPYWVGKQIQKSGIRMYIPLSSTQQTALQPIDPKQEALSNYEDNITHWQVGDLVIHRADAKKPEMLMKVVGYTPTGLCITEYINKNYLPVMKLKQKYTNEIKYLLDPKAFGLVLI
jgi:hypothetical protein